MGYKDVGEHQFQMANVFELIEKFVERRALGHATRSETYPQYLIMGWRDLDTDEFFFVTILPLKEGLTDFDKMMKGAKKGRDGSIKLPGFRMLGVLDKDAVDRMRVLRDMPWKEKLGYTQMEIRDYLIDVPGRIEFFDHPK